VTEEGWKLASDPAEKLDREAGARLDDLKTWLARHMRVIRLPELLIEVDNELDVTKHSLLPAFQGRRTAEDVRATIATIMAHGCNIGPYTMARLTEDVPCKQIKRITDWQLTEENQRAPWPSWSAPSAGWVPPPSGGRAGRRAVTARGSSSRDACSSGPSATR
jgi:hypothetical protein